MATFQPLDPARMNQASLDPSSRDSFSRAFDNEVAIEEAQHSESNNQFATGSYLYPKPDFDVGALQMGARLPGNSTDQPQTSLTEPLRSHFPLSPPASSTVSPTRWPHEKRTMFPPEIFTNAQDSSSAYTFYGQMTPPDDENESLPDMSLNEQFYGSPTLPSSTSDQHRRGSSTADSQPKSRSKRSRKSARGPKKLSLDPNDPNDVRRSKFLERNRVAASKCRQKKKEWTQNLEGRARDLQSENNNLRLWLDSLRDEFVYLKTQIAEHRGCNSQEINEYLDDPKRDLLAFNNPASRNLLDHMRRQSIKLESDDDEQSGQTEPTADDEDALGALLADSIIEATAT